MRLERGPEPRLALELGTRRRQLLARVLEDSLASTPAFADRLAALVGPGRLGDSRSKQDASSSRNSEPGSG